MVAGTGIYRQNQYVPVPVTNSRFILTSNKFRDAYKNTVKMFKMKFNRSWFTVVIYGTSLRKAYNAAVTISHPGWVKRIHSLFEPLKSTWKSTRTQCCIKHVKMCNNRKERIDFIFEQASAYLNHALILGLRIIHA